MELKDINNKLERISDLLDIKPSIRSEVELIYAKVSEHLCRPDSQLLKYSPNVYPQGSFRIHTVVKPVNFVGDIDVDIVCELSLDKDQISKAELKDLLGSELKKFKYENIKAYESGRCWVLELGGRIRVDILPCIPAPRTKSTVFITDKEIHFWLTSNPKGYAEWFLTENKKEAIDIKKSLREFGQAEIEDLPDIDEKLPLQKVVQLLKRHRDVFFRTVHAKRPPSILITTLMTKVNKSNLGLYEKLIEFQTSSKSHIVKNKQDKWELLNPADELKQENFVDKWNLDPSRKTGFDAWLMKLLLDLNKIKDATDSTHLNDIFDVKELENQSEYAMTESLKKSLNYSLIPDAGSTSHLQTPNWPAIPQLIDLKVIGSIHKQKEGFKYKTYSEDYPIERDRWIKFSVLNQLPKGTELYWQVVNTGEEARLKNGLRGEVVAEPKEINWERTEYKGTHYIIAYAVVGGRIIGKSKMYKVRITY